MDLGLQGSFGAAERLGHLGIRQIAHVAEDERRPVALRHLVEELGPSILVGPGRHDGLWTGGGRRGGFRRPADDLRQRRRRSTVGDLPATVARQIHGDRGEPRTKAKGADAVGVVAVDRPIGPDEDVLGHLFGIAWITGQAQGDREQPVGMTADERLEGVVEVGGEPRREGLVLMRLERRSRASLTRTRRPTAPLHPRSW